MSFLLISDDDALAVQHRQAITRMETGLQCSGVKMESNKLSHAILGWAFRWGI